jgi:hypothetical protein
MPVVAQPLQPPPFAKYRKINSRRGIPPLRAITGTELQGDLLVSIRNPQWHRGDRICWRGSQWHDIGVSLTFPRPLRGRHQFRRNVFSWLVDCLATALAAFFASVRVNPRGHRSRVGPRIIGDDEAFPLRQLLGVQQLCWTYRFGVELTGCFTVGLFGGVFAKEFAADRYRCLIAGRWFDALLPDEAAVRE